MPKNLSLRHAVVAIIGALTASAASAAIDFKKEILPILEQRCVKCHAAPKEENGKTIKPKAGLRLDAAWAILKGSDDRVILTPGNIEKSSLYEVVTLPTDDDKFMPPTGKADPLNKEELGKLKAWILEGADFGGWEGSNVGKPEGAPSTAKAKGPAKDREHDLLYKKLSEGLKPVPEDVQKKVAAGGAQISILLVGSPLLRVDFLTGVSKCDDKALETLAPIKENIAHLDLARTKVTDDALKVIATMPRLTRLDLRKTKVTDKGLESLTANKNLNYLNIYETEVTDAGAALLGKMKSLQHVYLYQSKVTAAGAKKLQADLPKCEVVFGAPITAPENKPDSAPKKRQK